MSKTWAVGAGAFLATVAAGMFIVLRQSPTVEPRAAAAAAANADAEGERITIPTLGLSVVRPSKWSTITADENVRNIRTVRMDDRQLQELAARYATVPIVAFAKFKEPYEDLNPSLKINVRSVGGFAGHPPEQILEAAIPTMRRMFGDLRIDYAPTRTQLSGKQAAYARLAYTMRVGDGEYPTISEIWVVPRGPVFFMIGAGTRADEKNGSTAEVHKIVDSIQIK